MNEYQEKLKTKMGEYLHFVYDTTEDFSKREQYGSSSQWRWSTLSILFLLNIDRDNCGLTIYLVDLSTIPKVSNSVIKEEVIKAIIKKEPFVKYWSE
ncbi:MAG: hypothetical protein U9R06_03130 [Patescibacteria group bacterium]|nr:hypothetical protein [Patescibacteria group bacterium]